MPVPDLAAYEELCLGWYLEAGRADAALLTDGDRPVGYALVCTDEAGYRHWAERAAVRWLGGAAVRAIAGHAGQGTGRFVALRVLDGLNGLRGPRAPMPAHVHVNVAGAARRGARASRMLLAHADLRCAAAGLPGWYGEINAEVGHRERALASQGLAVVRRMPNRTLSALSGRRIARLTVVRHLA